MRISRVASIGSEFCGNVRGKFVKAYKIVAIVALLKVRRFYQQAQN